MDVVVVESPAKAKTIERYLGRDFTVLASYGVGSERRGTLAVIGPTRMDYPHTISAVNLVARSLSGFLDDLAS